jgi:WD40 repeat protein
MVHNWPTAEPNHNVPIVPVLGPSLTLGESTPASITHGHGDGDILAVARSDGRVEVWNLSSRSRVTAFQCSSGALSVQYVEEPDELAGPIRVHWGDAASEGVDDLKVHHALGQLALCHDNLVELIALDGTTMWQRACSGADARLAFTPDGSVVRWAREEWGLFLRANGEPQAYTAPLITAVSVDGARMLIAYDSGEIDLQGESPVIIAPAGSARVEHVAFVAGDDRILAATHHALSLIDRSGARQAADLGEAPSNVIHCLATSSDGRSIAAGGSFMAYGVAVGTLWLWDKTSTPKLLAPPGERHSHPVLALAFTADGRLVSLDAHSIRVWSRDGAPIEVLAAGVADLVGMHVTASEIWAYGKDGSIHGWSHV